MDLYDKYQPVTWGIGVIGAGPEKVSHTIKDWCAGALWARDAKHITISRECRSLGDAMSRMQPLGLADKFLQVETIDGRTALFGNSFFAVPELLIWSSAIELQVPAYYIRNVPNTISHDQRSGEYGARILEFRKPEDPYGTRPTFYIGVINDAGKWWFGRDGDEQSFEEVQAYRALRKPNRFTVDMLVRYCRELKIPVYDSEWYSDRITIIQGTSLPNVKGLTYQEARQQLRIDRRPPSRE